MEAKSQLFLKYFTLFMNLLNDCGEAGGAVLASKLTFTIYVDESFAEGNHS